MLVYKFGGASLKDAASVQSLLSIIEKQKSEKLVLVVSAMGKMTNAFELLLKQYRNNVPDKHSQLDKIMDFHFSIMNVLFEKDYPVFNLINECLIHLEETLHNAPNQSYDYAYDQCVSYGELFSSLILSEFLKLHGIKNTRMDASELLITNDKYRDAEVDLIKTEENIAAKIVPELEKVDMVLTQGFIGGTLQGIRTTIGREGSDYSAAILAHFLNSSQLTVWKDVPGILNADPKLLPSAQSLKHISYHEAVELAFYGASVIHPRTLQPLKAKQIPLYVRSFLNPDAYSLIDGNSVSDGEIPSFIIKEKQILFSIASRDFGFIDAEKLAEILNLFSTFHFHIRVLQNSALNFSLLADENPLQLEDLLQNLKTEYSVKYNRNLSLLTIRHMQDHSVTELFKDTEILLEMHSRSTQQYVLNAPDLDLKLEELTFFV